MAVRTQGELLTFFALVFGLASGWWLMAAFQLPSNDSGAWVLFLRFTGAASPAGAALLMIWLDEGGSGLRRLLARATRIAWSHTAVIVIIVLPIVASVATVAACWMVAGGTSIEPTASRSILAGMLIAGVLSPILEEPGWRGFALPRLLSFLSPLKASMILGAIWALWHAPLFFIPGTPQSALRGDPFEVALFAAEVVALAVLFTALSLRTGGSVLAAIMFHGAVNLGSATIRELLVVGTPGRIAECLVYVGAAVLAAQTMQGPDLREERRPAAG